MAQKIFETIKTLTEIPSPSGDAYKAIDYVGEFAENLGYPTYVTNKGALMITVQGDNDVEHRCITAHVDTLGAMVKEVKEDGRLGIELIGGYAFNAIEGEYCTIHTDSGKDYTGTICLHETSVHVYKDNHTIPRDKEHMEVRIDAVTRNDEETRQLGIEVGDFISLDPRTVFTANDFIKSRHLDDKASVAMIMDFLEKLKENGKTLPYTTHFFISNNEEIGYGANASIPGKVKEYIAFDMGALGDGQTSDEYTVSICAKDASGPYHKKLRQHLTQLAQNNEIPYKVDIYPYYGSDASAALRSGADIKHGLFGAGIESSHALERTHIDSIKATQRLLEAYLFSDMVED
ncbi:M42 family metallopeptidase [Staphylococcus sp. EZ-P03]|uniref:M42 family metallopeptidase n=1 Tax=Staphylococcus sp. EZ-P03 TaxID=2282739 RepID=UPI000DF80911|nr:M42 family metallopeptidase [Staphylococcus sp. EZ-P03]